MDSDFKKWVAAIGFNRKEVAKAGELIGIGRNSSQERNQGLKDCSLTERLAMSAIAAGLPPWEPSNEEEIEACRQIIEPFRKILADQRPSYRPSASSGRHIPAE
jgi:hypothetical protein